MTALAYSLDVASPLWRGIAGVEAIVARAVGAVPETGLSRDG